MARRRTPILAGAIWVLVATTGLPAVQAQPAAADGAAADGALRQQVVVEVDEPGGAQGAFTAREVSADELARLQDDPRVERVLTGGHTVGLAMAESVPFVGAPQRWAAGFRGAGKVIVVVDTGVAPDFGGELVGQACFASTEVALGVRENHCGPQGDQPSAFDQTCFDLGVCEPGDVLDPAAGQPCAVTPGDPSHECQHGSAVAAVAGREEPTPGMAPDAGIYAIRVFDPTGSTAELVDVFAALEHVIALADTGHYDFAAVNLSIATASLFGRACDDSPALGGMVQPIRYAVEELAARRIPVVAASGNEGDPGAIAFPACLSTTVSVGATDLDDDVAPFTNTGPGLDLVAPGTDEASSLDRLDVPSAPGYDTEWRGTSFAAPHVAGALALVEQEYPATSVAQRTWLLRESGVPVTSGGRTHRRLRLTDPAGALYAGVLVPGSAPVGGAPRAVTGDFDGDGRADLLAHAPGPAGDLVSYGLAVWGFDVHQHQVSGSYHPLVGDFAGAAGGPDDVLWYAPGPAPDSLWAGRTDRSFDPSSLSIAGTYVPYLGDFDGDGWDDVFWDGAGPDHDSIWYGGSGGFAPVDARVGGSYRVAVGDYDGDGRDDLFFHGPGAATDSVWLGTAARGSFAPFTVAVGDGSHAPLAGDFDGDGRDDVFLYAPGPGTDLLWRNGSGGVTVQEQPVNGTYATAVGDIDGDGRDDILWHGAGPATDSIWFGQATGQPAPRQIAVGGDYRPLLADTDASGSDDVVWYSPTTTVQPVWWSH